MVKYIRDVTCWFCIQIFRVSRDIKTVVLGEVTPLERGQSAEESCENSGSHEELL